MENDRLLESLRAAVELAPHDAALRIHLARMLLLAGKPGDALEHAQVASALAPDDEEARELLQDIESAESTPRESSPTPGPPGEKARTSPDPALVWDVSSREPSSLRDVAGLESVKARLETEFLGPARNPELAARYGKRATGGLLLLAPLLPFIILMIKLKQFF